jgi:hypothetical protein
MAFDDFKTKNYPNSLFSPELDARHLARLFTGDIADGFTVVPGTGLQVILQPGNGLIRYGSAFVASARLVSLVDVFPMTVPTPDVSNPRIDLVVVYTDISASLPGGTPTILNLDGPGITKAKIVTGTPNASPTAPTSGAIQSSIGASNPYTIVAQILVNNGVSVIAANKITDIRALAAPSKSLALGRVSYVDSGCVWSTLTSLNGAMTAGLVYFSTSGVMVPVVVASIATHGFTASKDTYVSVDINGVITYTEQTNGGASPALPTNSVWLGKVVTSGSAITSIGTAGLTSLFDRIRPIAGTTSVQSYANPGSAGGTFYYAIENGIKKLWGQTGSISFGATSGQAATASLGVTFPSGFFSAITGFQHSMGTANSTNYMYSEVMTSPTTSSVGIGLVQTAGGPGNSTVYIEVKGS